MNEKPRDFSDVHCGREVPRVIIYLIKDKDSGPERDLRSKVARWPPWGANPAHILVRHDVI